MEEIPGKSPRSLLCAGVDTGVRDPGVAINIAWLVLMLAGVLMLAQPAIAREVRVGVYENEPKIMLGNDGGPSGILGDLLQEIARREGWRLRPVPCEWQACLEALQSGAIDLMPDVAHTDDRDRIFDFHTVPALHSWSQVYRHSGETMASMPELHGKRVAVLAGSVQESYLKQLLAEFGVSATLVPVRDLSEGFALAGSRTVDAVVANHRYGDLHALRHNLVQTPIMFQPARLFYATGSGVQGDLLTAIDAHLKSWQGDTGSVYYDVLRRWGAPQQQTRVPAAFWWGGAAVLALLLLAVAAAALLRRQVYIRTRDLLASEDRLATILNSVDAYIYIKDMELRYQYANRKVCELFGRPQEQVTGRIDSDFFDQATAAHLQKNDRRVIEGGERIVEEEVNKSRDGSAERIFLSVKLPLREPDGRIYALCGISTDITEQRRFAEEIHQLSFYDHLTHLPNRRQFLERLSGALKSPRPAVADGALGNQGALLLVNLDYFKMVNDALGYDKGDQLLQDMAKRLLQHVRVADFLGRLGGDEFGLLVAGLDADPGVAAREVELRARQILADISQPYELGGRRHLCTASVGIAMFSDDEDSAEEILLRADMATQRAKSDGRNSVRFFDPLMQAQMLTRAAIDTDMRLALREGQFLLYYQPQVDKQGLWVGCEALVRWRHPQRGMESPADFIPVAEDSGLILPLGRWILETACRQLVAWSSQPQTSKWFIAVNVSAYQFQHPDFVKEVLAVLEETGADPRLLELELTESQLVQNFDDVIAKMSALKDRGVRFSLDDFGTGYSSLLFLKRLPLDKLKIDQSFIRDLMFDADSEAIVSAVVGLGKSLELEISAEGVETQEQREALIAIGCHLCQGYLFARPVPAEDILKLLPGSGAAIQ
jgi:diguanylate cyclase (GGDEF)-like protein/PAS domain S-box-containing protein